MRNYRMYYLDFEHRIRGMKEFEAVDDIHAIAKAYTLSNGARYEIWNHDRLVERSKFLDADV